MAIRDLIFALDARLNLSLARFPQDVNSWVLPLPQPVQLTKRVSAISSLFDEGRPAEPPSKARINALGRLRDGKIHITRKDWNLISWGLCDMCGHAGMPIENASMFEKIMHFVDSEITQGISRKIWFGLMHSYFSYPQKEPESNQNWLLLRDKLSKTLPLLIQSQARPKAWSRALERQSDLLTVRAGIELGRELFENNKELAHDVATFFPIPDTSWLWRRIISRQLAMLFEIDDERFLLSIPTMLRLAVTHPQQADSILSALLSRYESSQFRNEAHAELKQFALDQWQNPQVKSANRWSMVSQEVRKMMLHWFAKADLEHFFSLLQGEGGVDRARLHYWLRFVDQIAYTKIVMGGDAFQNQSVDFIDFRIKNKGRFSQLSGGDSANNAFIIRIGEYYFVEFSGKGNACYLYSVARLPFDPEIRNFSLFELKRKPSAIDRIIHNGDWQYKADYQLSRLGIFFDKPTAKIIMPSPTPPASLEHIKKAALIETWPMPSIVFASRSLPPMSLEPVIEAVQLEPVTKAVQIETRPMPTSTTALNFLRVASLLQRPAPNKNISTTLRAIDAALELSKTFNLVSEDHRSKGGAFWILEAGLTPELRIQLEELKFASVAKRGYWMK